MVFCAMSGVIGFGELNIFNGKSDRNFLIIIYLCHILSVAGTTTYSANGFRINEHLKINGEMKNGILMWFIETSYYGDFHYRNMFFFSI